LLDRDIIAADLQIAAVVDHAEVNRKLGRFDWANISLRANLRRTSVIGSDLHAAEGGIVRHVKGDRALLRRDRIQEPGALVGEAVVVVAPARRRQQVVE